MEADADPESAMMIAENCQQKMQIDPSRARFPCCIVWSPLPVISWLVPFIGHVGICREDGVILDFAGPNFVCVDNFAFGSATRYIHINKEKLATYKGNGAKMEGSLGTTNRELGKLCCTSPYLSAFDGDYPYQPGEQGKEALTWDDALRKSTQEFQNRAYNLFTCNCHSFVANNLNRLGFSSGGWNVVNLAALIFLKGQWVSKVAVVRTFLPFVVVTFLGLTFGGLTYLSFLAFFIFLLVGWFLLGTYCFKNLIQL